jgi:alpha-mannosidase
VSPHAASSLLTRCVDGRTTITRQTDVVHKNLSGETVTFNWVAAHSSGTSAADSTFHLTINGKQALSLTTVKERRVWQWAVRGIHDPCRIEAGKTTKPGEQTR